MISSACGIRRSLWRSSPGVCQSCVNTTCSNAVARRLMRGMIWSPSFTASEPPGVKQFCTSITRRTSCAVGFIFMLPVCAAATRAAPANPATTRLAAVPLRNPRRSLVNIFVPPSRVAPSTGDSATILARRPAAFSPSPVAVPTAEEVLDERPHLGAVPFARTHDHPGRLAARTDEKSRRERRHPPAVGGLGIRVEENRKRELQVAHVGLEQASGRPAIHGDGHHDQPALAVALPQCLQRGHLERAGPAPGGPEVQDDELVAVVRQRRAAAVERTQRERRCLLTFLELDDAGLLERVQ